MITLVLDLVKPQKYWAICHHYMNNEMVFQCVTNLDRVRDMPEARLNSEWRRYTKHYGPTTPVTVQIVEVSTNRFELEKKMQRGWRENGKPPCNANGHLIERARRMIRASDGRIFDGQTEAARVLGVSQSAISLHLRGGMPRVKGLILQYAHEYSPTGMPPVPGVPVDQLPVLPPVEITETAEEAAAWAREGARLAAIADADVPPMPAVTLAPVPPVPSVPLSEAYKHVIQAPPRPVFPPLPPVQSETFVSPYKSQEDGRGHLPKEWPIEADERHAREYDEWYAAKTEDPVRAAKREALAAEVIRVTGGQTT